MVLHFHYKTELVAFYSVFCQNYRDNDPTNSKQNILEIFKALFKAEGDGGVISDCTKSVGVVAG